MTARHLALVGPTASGKTELAVSLARRRNDVELVSIDAMAVYRELDIATAKPSPVERVGISWHLIDLVDPSEEFSVARFVEAYRSALAAIEGRGHRAVLVGGTGLYHRAALDELVLPGRYPELAARLAEEAERPGGLAAAYRRLSELDPLAASRTEATNRRRVLRALEVTLGSGRPFSSFGPGLSSYPETTTAIVGLSRPRPELYARIAARLESQFAAGLLEEATALYERREGLSRTARQALGYRELFAHLAGGADLTTAKAEILVHTRRFARRQESWFRRDPRVAWHAADERDLVGLLDSLLG